MSKVTNKELEVITGTLALASMYGLKVEIIQEAIHNAYTLGKRDASARVESSKLEVLDHSLTNALNDWDL